VAVTRGSVMSLAGRAVGPGSYTDLPMPAHAEIVLEGATHPGETAPEGPFGEFTGYYAGGRSEQPVVRVERIYHRNDPILGLACPMVPPSDFSYSKCVMKAGMIWDEVERAWEIMDPLIRAWGEGRAPLDTYEAGTWGPPSADALLAPSGHAWRRL